MSRRANRVPAQGTGRILAMPLALAVLTLVGLILGLTGDGWRDGLAALLILLPLALFGRFWWRRR